MRETEPSRMLRKSEEVSILTVLLIFVAAKNLASGYNVPENPTPSGIKNHPAGGKMIVFLSPRAPHVNLPSNPFSDSEKPEKGAANSFTFEPAFKRNKRESGQTNFQKPLPQQLVSSPRGTGKGEKFSDRDDLLPTRDAIRGPSYATYPVKEFDGAEGDDLSQPKRRRNDSADSREDNAQRDKRTFVDGGGGGENGEVTTTLPYWKRKKENPQFITGRGSASKGTDFGPAQHRSLDNARESHSLKNSDSAIQSSEIGRSNQDNYYSSTVRRTYGRQYDEVMPSTPKSVYDTLDYSKRSPNGGRLILAGYEDGRFRDSYNSEQYPNVHPIHDRPYHQMPPYPSENFVREGEQYYRIYEPNTGRFVYYADGPENGRSGEYRALEPPNRGHFVGGPFPYDDRQVNYQSPRDFGYSNAMRRPMRPMEYMRAGRSNAQFFSYPYSEPINYQRDPRFTGGYERGNRIPDDVRNKTYIIYDADDRSQFTKPQHLSDFNRFDFGPPVYYSEPREPFRRSPMAPPSSYFSPLDYSSRQQVYPSPQHNFVRDFNPNRGIRMAGKWQMVPGPNANGRPYYSPEVQLPISAAVSRNFQFRDAYRSHNRV